MNQIMLQTKSIVIAVLVCGCGGSNVGTASPNMSLGEPVLEKSHPLRLNLLGGELAANATGEAADPAKIKAGSEIRISGTVKLRDPTKTPLKGAAILIVVKRPDGSELVVNSGNVKFELVSPGTYRFSRELAGPLKAGKYEIKVREHGIVLVESKLHIM